MPNIEVNQDATVHVAVAVIVNDKGQVLVAKRPDHVHQGGLWEFPGGKVEKDETVIQALLREIKEELNISILHYEPLIKIKHDYSDKSVVLDTWLIKDYDGVASGAEGQSIKWMSVVALPVDEFPLANKPIITALKIPDLYMISGRFESIENFKNKLSCALSKDKKIVQLRCKDIKDSKEYLKIAATAKIICDEFDAKLLLNTSVNDFELSTADGLHLDSRRLFQYKQRPINGDVLLSVSCHNQEEIKQAKLLAADIILLSPVKETLSHPGVKGIGWDVFSQLVDTISCPVFALGGMSKEDVSISKQHGGRGIAAISTLWNE